MRRWKFRLVGESLLSWALWCGVPAAMAQDPQLTSVFPMAGTRGTTVDLEIRGKNLVHAAGLWADCDQIHASVQRVEEIESPPVEKASSKPAKQVRDYRVKLRLDIAATAKIGAHALRLFSPHGVSNPLAFQVTTDSVVVEPESSGSIPTDAHPLRFPAMVAGRIAVPGEIDRYRIDVAAGQELLFEVVTGTGLFPAFYSNLYYPGSEAFREPQLAIYAATASWLDPGRLSPVRATDHSLYFQFPRLTFLSHYLPRLTHRFEKPGTYIVEVGAGEGTGSPDFSYGLRIAAVDRDAAESSWWTPRELAHSSNPDWNEHTFSRTLDAGRLRTLASRTHPANLAVSPSSKPRPRARRRRPRPGVTQPGLPDVEVPVSNVQEREPNDDVSQAANAAIPALLEGSIARPGDLDLYRFRVNAGDKLAFEVQTTDVTHPYFTPRISVLDSEGRELLNNLYRVIDGDGDDWIKTPEAKALHTFAQAGDYYLKIQDLTSRNGNPRFGYRVLIRPQIPHLGRVAPKIFRVSGSSTEIEEDRVNLVSGEARKLAFLVEREEGLGGDLALSVENLPPGVEAYAASILDQATYSKTGEIIEGRYEVRGTIDREEYRPGRRVIYLCWRVVPTPP